MKIVRQKRFASTPHRYGKCLPRVFVCFGDDKFPSNFFVYFPGFQLVYQLFQLFFPIPSGKLT